MHELQIEILQAKPEHLAQIEDLWRAIARESNPEDDKAPSREVKGLSRSLQSFGFLESDSFWLLLARVDGDPVGYLTTVRIPKADGRIGVLYIDELYVLKAYRRRGVGSALMQEVCRIGQELGFWRIRLNADESDPGVCAFYRANGFCHRGNGFFQRQVPKRPEKRPPPPFGPPRSGATVDGTRGPPLPERPNILIVYTDQQRYDTIGALGNNVIRTPNLDRLVAEGVALTQATTPSPVCMPARWSLHAGQWTTTHRCYSNHHPGIRPDTDLPRILREAGYRVGLSGKNHSFLQPSDFDFWDERPRPLDDSAWQVRQAWIDGVQHKQYPRLAEEPVPGGVAADPARAKTDAALRFVDISDNRPFFLWLSYVHPHTPYMVPEPYFSMYENAPVPEPVVEPDGLHAAGKPFRQVYHQRNNDAILPFTPQQVMTMRRVYYGQISLVDAEIGRLLDHLDRRGLVENTLIVYTSDHGDYMGDHGLMTKSPSLYDCLVRVPLIVRWPGHVDAGRRDVRFASHVDLLPTLAAAAEVSRPEQAQGVDLLPFLRDGGTGGDIRPFVYSEYGLPGLPYDEERITMSTGFDRVRFVNPLNDLLPWEGNPVSLAGRIRMVRTHEWKYVQELEGTCELYDLVNDPHELVNLWNQPAHANVQRELERRLHACIELGE